MVLNTIRDYLSEFRKTQLAEWKIFQSGSSPDLDLPSDELGSDFRRLAAGYHHKDVEAQLTAEYKQHYADTYYGFAESDVHKGQPFEFYTDADPSTFPDNRQPAPGIKVLPLRYHPDQVVTATEDVPETGYSLHPLLRYLIYSKYPQFLHAVHYYCRPLGTTDATFTDFNREQKPFPEVPQDLTTRIVTLICILLNLTPVSPLHYIDTFFAKLPLSTGVSYFYRHSYEIRTHAAFSHNKDYSGKITSKGYFLNAFTEWARTVVHRIKQYGLPFSPENLSPQQISDRLKTFFQQHATMLFTRNHISVRPDPTRPDIPVTLKQRPVYAMDTLFLHLECMLTFAFQIQCRSIKSSLMYSLETIRGGCAYMESRARAFTSYLCIDWSSFDQRMPWIIVDTFFTVFLPRLLVVNHAYQPTTPYPEYKDLDSHAMFSRLYNIINMLRTWYYNCVFVTADGYAYVRTLAGVASGMFNTQFLDTYCVLYLMIHALYHFGCSDAEILDMAIFAMGDDNVMLTHWDLSRLKQFMLFFETHARTRFGMEISKTKSIYTSLRSKIEMLGYQCNNGNPRRPEDKLIAQFCYPEHGYQDKYMSDRAIGAAFALAFGSTQAYNFFKDAFHTFLPFRAPDTPEHREKIKKHMPGMFKMLDYPEDFLFLVNFPSQEEIRSRYRIWQGELDPYKRWNPAHFKLAPDFLHPDFLTMQEYMAEHNHEFPDLTRLF